MAEAKGFNEFRPFIFLEILNIREVLLSVLMGMNIGFHLVNAKNLIKWKKWKGMFE